MGVEGALPPSTKDPPVPSTSAVMLERTPSSTSAPMTSTEVTALRRHSSLPARMHVSLTEVGYPPLARRASLAGPRPSSPISTAPLVFHTPPSATLTPALAVRANLIQRIILGFNGLGGDTRIALAVKGFLTLGQVVAFSTVLGITANDSCDKPLQVYLAVHLVRSALSYPLSFYASLLPPAPSGTEPNSPERRAAREARRVVGSEQWDSRVKMFSDLLLIIGLIFFCIGNTYLWTSKTCRMTSPPLYYSSLAALIIGYFYLAEIVLIILAIVFFLPLAVILLSALGYTGKKPDIGPLGKEDIEAIPLVLFVPADEDVTTPAAEAESHSTSTADAVAPPSAADTPSPPPPPPIASSTSTPAIVKPVGRRRRLARLLWSPAKRRRSRGRDRSDGKDGEMATPYGATPYPLHPLPSNLSTCPICLCDFEEPPTRSNDSEAAELAYEPLRLLPCGHCLHKDCLDPWLGTSGRCPVCQAPVKPMSKSKRRRATITSPPNDPDLEQ